MRSSKKKTNGMNRWVRFRHACRACCWDWVWWSIPSTYCIRPHACLAWWCSQSYITKSGDSDNSIPICEYKGERVVLAAMGSWGVVSLCSLLLSTASASSSSPCAVRMWWGEKPFARLIRMPRDTLGTIGHPGIVLAGLSLETTRCRTHILKGST